MSSRYKCATFQQMYISVGINVTVYCPIAHESELRMEKCTALDVSNLFRSFLTSLVPLCSLKFLLYLHNLIGKVPCTRSLASWLDVVSKIATSALHSYSTVEVVTVVDSFSIESPILIIRNCCYRAVERSSAALANIHRRWFLDEIYNYVIFI